jgi:hypothetical protein
MAAAHVLAAPERFGRDMLDLLTSVALGAGRAAMHVEAAHYLAGAVTIAERVIGNDHPRTLEILLKRAEHLRRSGNPSWVDLAWVVVQRAEATNAHDLCAFGAAALCQVGPLIRAGSLDPAVADTVERALARPLSPLARSICAGQATLLYSASGNIARCRELFDVALASAQESGDDRALLEVYASVVVSLTHPSDWHLGADLAAEMLSLAEQLDDDDGRFSALHLYFSVQVQFGDPLLRTTFVQQAALAKTLRSEGRTWMAEYQRAVVAFLDGRLDEAESIAANNASHSPMHESRTTSTYFMLLYVVRVAQGRGQELAPALDAIVTDQQGLPGWRTVATWLAALRGDTARVLADCDALDCGDALPEDMTWSGAMMLLGRAVATTGDHERCRALLQRLSPWTGHMTWYGSGTVGPIDLALAELALAAGDLPAALRFEAAAKRIVARLRAVVYQPDLDHLATRLHP